MKVLVDTDAYSALMRGHSGLAVRVRHAQEVFLSVVVAGELMFGFRSGGRYEQNMKELRAFLGNPYVSFVPVTMITADRFSFVAGNLKKKGAPIPTNDIWIAAHAMEIGADLLSFRHFSQVDGLVWVTP